MTIIATLIARLLPERWRQRLAVALGEGLGEAALEGMMIRLAAGRSQGLSPDEALRFLFRLDAKLYALQGDHAVRWGHGVHPKHRVMAYHDFFVDRLVAGERVLDLGCGQGALAQDMAQRAGVEVVAMDLSPENIRLAKAHHGHDHVSYRVGNVLSDLPGESFHVVVMSNVLEHLPPDRSRFVRTVQQGCAPRCWLIRVPAFDRDWRVPVKQELGVEWRLDNTHDVEYTLATLTRELTEAGLVLDETICRWGEYWLMAHSPPTPVS